MLNYRKANPGDIHKLVELKKRQIEAEGLEPTINIDKELTDFFQKKLSEGTLIQWVVEDEAEIIACGAVIFYEFPPRYTNRTGIEAYIANMYTEENYRGQGIATNILARLVEEVRNRNISKIWLETTEMGKPVYKKFGFIESNDYLVLNITT